MTNITEKDLKELLDKIYYELTKIFIMSCRRMNKRKIRKLSKLLALTGVLGGAMTIHHKLEFGRWWDSKTVCHGKIGAGIISSSLIGILGLGILEGNDR